nr:DUF2062 domain-containing protein [Rhizobium aegyptiacum]
MFSLHPERQHDCSCARDGVWKPTYLPVIFAAAYRIGIFVLGRAPEKIGEANLFTLLRHLDFAPLWHPILKPVLVGGLPLGAFCGAVFYLLTWQGVRLFQQRRTRQGV